MKLELYNIFQVKDLKNVWPQGVKAKLFIFSCFTRPGNATTTVLRDKAVS